MPLPMPHHLKAPGSIRLEPKKITSKIMNILYLDLSGRTNNDIAEMVGITPSRVSIIKNSPMYKDRREEESAKLSTAVIEKQSERVVHGDLVEQTFETEKQVLAKELLNLALNAESEQVRKSAIVDALGYIGYKPKVNSIVTTVEIDHKMQKAWDRVMTNDKYGKTERASTVRITQEMPE